MSRRVQRKSICSMLSHVISNLSAFLSQKYEVDRHFLIKSCLAIFAMIQENKNLTPKSPIFIGWKLVMYVMYKYDNMQKSDTFHCTHNVAWLCSNAQAH